jgi:hypothetical protein
MKLSISKSGSFLNNGNSISFIKGMNNTINFINSTTGLVVEMEVENANKFVKIYNQINNVKPASLNSELIEYSATFIIFKFNFKTV